MASDTSNFTIMLLVGYFILLGIFTLLIASQLAADQADAHSIDRNTYISSNSDISALNTGNMSQYDVDSDTARAATLKQTMTNVFSLLVYNISLTNDGTVLMEYLFIFRIILFWCPFMYLLICLYFALPFV